jgi:hypothetical protein
MMGGEYLPLGILIKSYACPPMQPEPSTDHPIGELNKDDNPTMFYENALKLHQNS